MVDPTFKLTGPEARHLLVGLQLASEEQLRAHPEWPSMRQAVLEGKLKYREADPEEHWQSYRELVEQLQQNGVAYGDCEDLATAISAEDNVRYGVKSEAYTYNPTPGLFHVVVSVPQSAAARFGGAGTWPTARLAPTVSGRVLQDPSAKAGMNSSGAFGALGKSISFTTEYGTMPSNHLPLMTRQESQTLGEIAAEAGAQLGVIFHGRKLAEGIYVLLSDESPPLDLTGEDLEAYRMGGLAAMGIDFTSGVAMSSYGNAPFSLFDSADDTTELFGAAKRSVRRVAPGSLSLSKAQPVKLTTSRHSSSSRSRKRPSVRSVSKKAAQPHQQQRQQKSQGQQGQQRSQQRGRPSGYRSATQSVMPQCSPDPLVGMLPFYDEMGQVIYCYPEEDYYPEDYAVAEALDYYGLLDGEDAAVDAAYSGLLDRAKEAVSDWQAGDVVRAVFDPAGTILREGMQAAGVSEGTQALFDPAGQIAKGSSNVYHERQIKKFSELAWGARHAGDEDEARSYVAKIEKSMGALQKAGKPFAPDDNTRKLLSWFRGEDQVRRRGGRPPSRYAQPQGRPQGRPGGPGGQRPPGYPEDRPWPPQGRPGAHGSQRPGNRPGHQQGPPGQHQQGPPGQRPGNRPGHQQGPLGQHQQGPPGQRPGHSDPRRLSTLPAARYGAMSGTETGWLFEGEETW